MSDRPRAEIISRIKACLKYADPKFNDNEHERATAKRAAEAMVAKYKVTSQELGVINSDEYIVTFTYTEADNLSALFSALRKSGVEPKRGWRDEP